jgi:ABC-type transport system substrate-binding protein
MTLLCRSSAARPVAMAVLLAAAAACSSGLAEGRASDAGLPRAAAQELVVAVGEDPFLRRAHPPAGPDRTETDLRVERLDLGLRTDGPNPGIFETLTRVTPSFGLGPGLARGWDEVSPTRWRFTLRPGVTFHDGRALDAAAVVETLEIVAGRQNRPRGLEPGAATAVDAHTVEVELTHPNLRLPEQLADPSTAIRAPGTGAGDGGDPTTTPTGTGPFRFLSYTPGQSLVVTANEQYWDGPPQLVRLTFLFGPDDDASRRLATREALAVGHVPTGLLPRLSGVDRRVLSGPARSAYLLLNVGGTHQWATLQEHAVRRAVALAIDRRVLTQAAWPGLGEPNDTLIPPAVLHAAAGLVSAPAHDLAEAQRLLDEAGWRLDADGVRHRDGQPLALSLIVAQPDELATAAQVVRRQLADAGIAVDLTDGGTTTTERLSRVNEGTFDLFLDLRRQHDANPCAFCRFFSIRPGGQLTISGVVGAGPRADALFEEAFTVSSADSARRAAAALMQVVVEEQVVAVPLSTLPSVWLLSRRVQGFDPAPLPGTQRWEHVWLSW